MMIPDRSPNKVTIEDLLRIKRAERPSTEFWTQFEQDLRAKQLAAIVEKRPWWYFLHLPKTTRVISRHQVPVGAAAILALSFVVLGQYYRPVAAPSEHLAPEIVAHSQNEVRQLAPSATVAPTASSPEVLVRAAAPQVASAASSQPTIMVNSTALASSPNELTAMIPWGVAQTDEDTTADRLLATDLQTNLTSNLSVVSLLGNVRSDENRIEVKPAVAQASSPRELRRAKILTGMVLADNAEGSDYSHAIHGRDIAANDLSEAQLYDSVRRLGVGGDRFTLKF